VDTIFFSLTCFSFVLGEWDMFAVCNTRGGGKLSSGNKDSGSRGRSKHGRVEAGFEDQYYLVLSTKKAYFLRSILHAKIDISTIKMHLHLY
jgi:hypothetical protein